MKMLLPVALMLGAQLAHAQTVELDFVGPNGVEKPAGTVTISETRYGAVLTPDLQGLPPGLHGFHLHEKPSCEASVTDGKPTPAGAAGGHWDPAKTGAHKGPYDDSGHQGDLPALYVGADGRATYPVLAPRLKAEQFKGHALMVHVGADNHSDHPEKLGGGGARMACGVVK